MKGVNCAEREVPVVVELPTFIEIVARPDRASLSRFSTVERPALRSQVHDHRKRCAPSATSDYDGDCFCNIAVARPVTDLKQDVSLHTNGSWGAIAGASLSRCDLILNVPRFPEHPKKVHVD